MAKNQLYTLEYPVRCSPRVLFDFLSTAAGFKEWFADSVIEKDNIFIFNWDKSEERAELLEIEPDKRVRFRWLNNSKVKDEYFEFKIEKTEISNQTILVITDFAEAKDIKDQQRLWDHQIKDLFHRIGIF